MELDSSRNDAETMKESSCVEDVTSWYVRIKLPHGVRYIYIYIYVHGGPQSSRRSCEWGLLKQQLGPAMVNNIKHATLNRRRGQKP